MRRYNITSRALPFLAVITFAFASPVLVQEKRQARVDVVPVLEDMKTVLWKRLGDQELNRLVEGLWDGGGVWGDRETAVIHPSHELAPPQELAPPLADSDRASTSGSVKLDEQPGDPPPGNPPPGNPPPGNPPPTKPWWSWTRWRRAIHGGI